MGQKVNPISFRLGYIKGWDSNWYANKKDFADRLMEDNKIRKYVMMRLSGAAISKIVIERTLKTITLSIHTARPGIVIGKGGVEIEKIREELKRTSKKVVQINTIEIRNPELNAKLCAESIASQLKARVSYKRAMKRAIEAAIRSGAKGIKIRLSGRLGGAEMARVEEYSEERVPLHTLRADIDYAMVPSHTIYGTIGVKVWIFQKEIYSKPNLSPKMNKDRPGYSKFKKPFNKKK